MPIAAASSRKAYRTCLWLASLSLLMLLACVLAFRKLNGTYWSSEHGSPEALVSCGLVFLFLVAFSFLELASKILAMVAIVRNDRFSRPRKAGFMLLLWLLGPLFLIPFSWVQWRASRPAP